MCLRILDCSSPIVILLPSSSRSMLVTSGPASCPLGSLLLGTRLQQQLPCGSQHDADDFHTCEQLLDSGEVCGRIFMSRRAPLAHQRMRLDHHTMRSAASMVMTNQCFFCSSVLHTRGSASMSEMPSRLDAARSMPLSWVLVSRSLTACVAACASMRVMTWPHITDTVHRMCTAHLISSCQVHLHRPLGSDPPLGNGLRTRPRGRRSSRTSCEASCRRSRSERHDQHHRHDRQALPEQRAADEGLEEHPDRCVPSPDRLPHGSRHEGGHEGLRRGCPANRRPGLGVPHVLAWNSRAKTSKLALEASSAQADKDTLGEIAQYIEKQNKEGWKGVVSEVTYARARKNYNKEFVCLESNVRDATLSRPLCEGVKKWINTARRQRAARSCPPRRPREEGAAVAGGERHERAREFRCLSSRQQHVAFSMLQMSRDKLREAATMRGLSSSGSKVAIACRISSHIMQ